MPALMSFLRLSPGARAWPEKAPHVEVGETNGASPEPEETRSQLERCQEDEAESNETLFGGGKAINETEQIL